MWFFPTLPRRYQTIVNMTIACQTTNFYFVRHRGTNLQVTATRDLFFNSVLQIFSLVSFHQVPRNVSFLYHLFSWVMSCFIKTNATFFLRESVAQCVSFIILVILILPIPTLQRHRADFSLFFFCLCSSGSGPWPPRWQTSDLTSIFRPWKSWKTCLSRVIYSVVIMAAVLYSSGAPVLPTNPWQRAFAMLNQQWEFPQFLAP